MLKEENAELLIDGKRVENDYTFVADDEEMKVEISYTFNASALGGKNLVTFEELYDLSNPDEPVKVAEHKDIEDDGQTVLITERIIKIHTTATDKDGNKELEAGKDVTIIDTLLYDMIANRITIDEVRAENGSLRLMKNLVWEYDALPHALIAGGTGGGKTYFLLTLIEALLHTNAVLYILDPKNADLADLGTVMGNVYHTKEEMIDCVNAFYEGMVQRSEEMKRHPNYKTGENYAYLGLPPCFLIFDEYVAFFEMLGTKESVSLLSQLKKIVMLGRQAGYFLIVACQRPDAKYFSDGIRDNFNFRVGLGRISELGYGMLFGSDVKKQFFQKRIKGRGYCDVGTSVISEFYTPLVPKGHDFLQEIGRLEEKRTASNES